MSDHDLKRIITDAKRVAVVGASAKPDRASHGVTRYLLDHTHFEVYPVNPNYEEVAGVECYHSLADLPVTPDLVVIFRRPEHVPGVVDEAIEARTDGVWMQLGITHQEAAGKAQSRGLDVVQDRCIKIEHQRLIGSEDGVEQAF